VTVGFGLVGCGGAAVDVAKALDLVPDARVAATFDRTTAYAEDLAASRGATVHQDLDALLRDPAVDIVYVGLPHDLLEPTALRAIEAGHHVLVEKPMALNLEGIGRIEQAATERDRQAGVVFELREVAAMAAARELIRDGAIGTLRSVRIQAVIDKPASYWRSGATGRVADDWRSHRDRAGGGVVLMNAIHQLDLVRWLTGREVVRVIGEVAPAGDGIDVEDRAAAALRLDDGTLVSLTATAHSPGATDQERMELDGTHGRLDLPDPYTDDPVQLYLGRIWEGLAPERWHPIDPPAVDPYVPFLTRVADAVAAGAPMPAGTRDAAAALRVVLAIYASAEAGRAIDLGPLP
jgi:UDP-N-acetyl-2-amino-2-deoxyglucuronate dehydrogenase